MKGKLITTAIVVCIFLMYSSCYKTGETIYQPICKPDSIIVSRTIYNYLNFYDYNMLQQFNGNLIYDANRRLTTAINLLGVPANHFDFIYDANNNLIRINDYYIV